MSLSGKKEIGNKGQKSKVKKVLRIIGIILGIIFLAAAAFLIYLSLKPAVPGNYESTVRTGGDIEAKYLGHGSCDIS